MFTRHSRDPQSEFAKLAQYSRKVDDYTKLHTIGKGGGCVVWAVAEHSRWRWCRYRASSNADRVLAMREIRLDEMTSAGASLMLHARWCLICGLVRQHGGGARNMEGAF